MPKYLIHFIHLRILRHALPTLLALISSYSVNVSAQTNAPPASPALKRTQTSQPATPRAPRTAARATGLTPPPAEPTKTTETEESPLFSNLPESLSYETGQLDSVYGKATVEILIPEYLRKFTQARTVEHVSLPQAVRLALDFSRDVKIAQSRVDQAQSQTDQARGLLLPTLSVRNAKGRETSSPASITDPVTGNAKVTDTHTRTDETITLRQPLFDAPSFLDWKRRDQIVDSRVGSLRGSEGDAYIATVQAYLSLATSLLLTDLIKDYEQQLTLLLDYVSQRAAAGASSDADMERVRARNLAARSSRLEQEAAYSAAVVEFVRLTNVTPKTLKLPRREEASTDIPTTLEQALQVSMDSNPELKTLKAELIATEKDINAAQARFLPRVDLEVTDTSVWNAGGAIGLQHDQRAMVVLNWSLINGTVDTFNLKEKIERKEEYEWRVDDQKRRLQQTLATQYATLEATRSRLAAGYKEWTSIYGAARAMSQRMLAGNQSLLDLLDVLERVQQARARLVTMHALEISSLAQISRYIGKLPYGSPMETTEAGATEPATPQVFPRSGT
ncbi:MAG TPA: TolC family protein [Rhodocyclaceae bacterium]|jgi:adhesin transport system outer membrane protein